MCIYPCRCVHLVTRSEPPEDCVGVFRHFPQPANFVAPGQNIIIYTLTIFIGMQACPSSILLTCEGCACIRIKLNALSHNVHYILYIHTF